MLFTAAGWVLLGLSLILLACAWIPLLAPVVWGAGTLAIVCALGLLWTQRERATERGRDRVRRAIRWTALALGINLAVTLLLQTISRQALIGPLRQDLEETRPEK